MGGWSTRCRARDGWSKWILANEFSGKMPEGRLYVVATPIGNLGDISQRAMELLENCDLILCEDTRVTGKLLHAKGIDSKPMLSYREENEKFRTDKILEDIRNGEEVVLVSDAGTPTISDPGFRLLRAFRKNNLPVEVCPGPCAAVAALSVSGLPTDRYYFVGFLPPKSAARKRFLQEYIDFSSTIIVYESVHRISKFLNEIHQTLGPERTICVARELTKKFETVITGPVHDVIEAVESRALKGEFVVLIAPKAFDL